MLSNDLNDKLTAMVEKGSPRLNMIGEVSPKLSRFLPTTSAIKNKSGGSPKGNVLSVLMLSIFTTICTTVCCILLLFHY
jgi:hypothetical protein